MVLPWQGSFRPPRRMPAGGPMSRPMLFERRSGGTTLIAGEAAARSKAAARGEVDQRRHQALDLVQACARGLFGGVIEVRYRRQEPARIGMRRPLEEIADLGLFDLAAGIHHDYPV